MTNDNETTGARLTEAQVALFQQRADEQQPMNYPSEAHAKGAVTILRETVRDLLADRAALVKENTRLQHAHDMNETTMNMQDRALKVQHADLANTHAQVTAMRPLVARVAKGVLVDSECPFCWTMLFENDGPHEANCPVTQARVLAATWAAEPTPAAPDTAATAANRQRYPHFALVWTVIDAVAAGDNERARAYADLLADHLDADNYPYEAKRIRSRLSPDYDPGPLLYLMAETPAAPTPETLAYACDECGWVTPLVKGYLFPWDMPNDELAWLCPNCRNNHPMFRDVPVASDTPAAPTPDGREGGEG